jgi:hypothetical protein
MFASWRRPTAIALKTAAAKIPQKTAENIAWAKVMRRPQLGQVAARLDI